MRNSFHIFTEKVRANALRAVENAPIGSVVKITPDEGRTGRQNRLSHAWYGEIAKQKRDTDVVDVKRMCKLLIGVPLLSALDHEFEALYSKIVSLPYKDQLKAMDYLSVTSLMNVKQFAQYLTMMQEYWAKQGIILVAKEPWELDAIGRK